jgi:hypothetical protein
MKPLLGIYSTIGYYCQLLTDSTLLPIEEKKQKSKNLVVIFAEKICRLYKILSDIYLD